MQKIADGIFCVFEDERPKYVIWKRQRVLDGWPTNGELVELAKAKLLDLGWSVNLTRPNYIRYDVIFSDMISQVLSAKGK